MNYNISSNNKSPLKQPRKLRSTKLPTSKFYITATLNFNLIISCRRRLVSYYTIFSFIIVVCLLRQIMRYVISCCINYRGYFWIFGLCVTWRFIKEKRETRPRIRKRFLSITAIKVNTKRVYTRPVGKLSKGDYNLWYCLVKTLSMCNLITCSVVKTYDYH